MHGADIRGPVGLIAGEGDLPAVVARHIAEREIPLVVYRAGGGALPGVSPERTVDLLTLPGADGKLNLEAVARDMMARGIRSVSLAGLVPKRVIYGDVSGAETLRILSARDNNDHALLGRVVGAFEAAGFSVIPYRAFIGDAIAPSGPIGGRAVTDREREDVDYGRKILSAILPLSFGQAIVVAKRSVVAVEAMEGTDEMIRRAGAILGGRGGVVVKMMRADQDERFDIPVVGLRTLEGMRTAGLTCLAVEADRTIILNPDEVRAFALASDMALEGIEA